jgi:hypothetical protein
MRKKFCIRILLQIFSCLIGICLWSSGRNVMAQFLDQGAITGTVQDTTGAVIPNASVKLESPDTGFILSTTADSSGVYVFSPIKIGKYVITASAPGFENLMQKNISLSQGQRLNFSPKLKAGAVSETVTITDAPPLLQSQDSSVGQVLNTQELNETPLNGRNTVYLVQLAPGVAMGHGSRGANTGDFEANGMRAEQNNFVIDGVDNNAVSVDYLGNNSYLVNPPPDALAEFKVSTSNYSSEYGHAAGAVVSASIKGGTNQFHGDLWEYWRNDILNNRDWTPGLPKGPYRQNMFGATLGGPVIKNKLFLFGDLQSNRIVTAPSQSPVSIPTMLMRQGNFSELLDQTKTSGGAAINLYEPQNNQTPMSCLGVPNVLCPGQIDAVAQSILNLFPTPNANNGAVYNNYVFSVKQRINTFQWDARMDWNISPKDQSFARFSYSNTRGGFPAPLGPILDGGGGAGSSNVSGEQINYGNNFVLSETHIFNPRLVNEFRFAYDYAHFNALQQNAGVDLASQLGLGGVPFGPATPNNGGIPYFTIGGLNQFGTRAYRPETETENEYQILDNVSWTLGNHSVRMGFAFQSVRSYTLEPPSSRPQYSYSGSITANPGVANTGYGVADFLTNNMSSGSIGPYAAFNNDQNNPSAYIQDDWKVNKNLTLNLGVRYDYFQPYKEMAGLQANFFVNSVGISTGSAIYALPAQLQGKLALNPSFLAVLAKDNISLIYDKNPQLVNAQHTNFAPRVGFAFTADPTTVFRGGFGMFYQGQENTGAANDLGFNYPFVFSDNFPSPSCPAATVSHPISNCANNGYQLETGFSDAISQGLTHYFNIPTLVGQSRDMKSIYAMDYNLAIEKAFSENLVATISYVGTLSRHLPININSNSSTVLLPSGSTQSYVPFPDFGGSANILYEGIGEYDALETKLQKRISHGLDFLATYTWSHAIDDAGDPLGGGIGGYRNPSIIPIRQDMTNSGWDTRHRFTFNGFYRLPFGRDEARMNHAPFVLDALLGGWAMNVTYQLQSGQPFSIGTANQTNVSGGTAYAIQTRNPFSPGGSPDPTNPKITCPTSVRNKAHWFNPCAFKNPLPASLLTPLGVGSSPTVPAPGYTYPSYITDAATAKLFLGGRSDTVYGPGYQRMDMSLFKRFRTFEGQYLEVRADGFNMLNTPAYGGPNGSISNTGGQITSAHTTQSYTPLGRFFQLAAKYVF